MPGGRLWSNHVGVKLWNPHRDAPDTGALLIKSYTGAHSKELAKQSEAELQSIVTQVSGNKKAVIDMLLKSVTTVS